MDKADHHPRHRLARYARLGVRTHIAALLALIVVLIALGMLWRDAIRYGWLSVSTLEAGAQWARNQHFAPLLVVAAYVVAGVFFLPFTPLVIVTGAVFGPLWGSVYAIAGALASALASYGCGKAVGSDLITRFGGERARHLIQQLQRRGFYAILFVRVVPVAPFSVINVVAGASGIRVRDFALGTLLGMVPGVVITVVLSDSIADIVTRPSASSVAMVVLGVVVLLLVGVAVRRWMKRRP
ncbi:TVP38/TMEM64 family protein [Uliginosibacterium sp. sgz301328]|uniref:TVP38/TMEM64 family protein n=1 Tax=Uliginosibacterium sp. sgz301328 TaxID=3243764 RepID=UPI00359CF2FA